MTLREFYVILGGDYADVLYRLKNEKTIEHFIKMFIEENLFKMLEEAIMSGDNQLAFRLAHSLKGNCLSLGFTHLKDISSEITEQLRYGHIEFAGKLLVTFSDEYTRLVKASEHIVVN